MPDPIDPAAKDWERALAKYGVIVPLVARVLEPAEREAVRRQILDATHQFPNGKHIRVAPRTLREWVQRYRAHNLEGLLPQGRKDKGKPRAIPPEVLARALALKAELPARSARAICDLLASEGGEPLSASTLGYHLRRVQAAPEQAPKAFRRFEHARPNDCWQSDLSDGLWLPDPQDPTRQRKCHLHAFLDDHSRLVPHAQFYWRESLPALEDCFRQAIVKHGIPRMVYWDNGAVFRATQLRKMAARLRVEIVFATPYAPEGKGKIERFFGVIKARFYPEAKAAGLTSLEDLNRFFAAWLERHYTDVVHSEIGGTPRARWEAGLEPVRYPTAEELADTFLWEEERFVRKTGDVSLAGNRYPVEPHLVGQRVMVRFDPFDLAEVKIVHRGVVVQNARPAELVARTFAKAVSTPPAPPRRLDSSAGFRERLVTEYVRAPDVLHGSPSSPSAGQVVGA